MRRLLLWLVNGLWPGLCLLSLLACAGVVSLWVHGSRAGEFFRRAAADGWDLYVALGRDGVCVSREATVLHYAVPNDYAGVLPQPPRRPGLPGLPGLSRLTVPAPCTLDIAWRQRRAGLAGVYWRRGWSGQRSFRLTASYPALLALTSLPPLLWLAARSRRLYVRRRRRRRGLCVRCGYDLRASPGRCPECGATLKRA